MKQRGRKIFWTALVVGTVAGTAIFVPQLQPLKARDGFSSDRFEYQEIPASQSLDTERISFTGEEWTGKGKNIDITSVNTLTDSVNMVPYADKETAFYGARDYAREGSAYYQLLSGEGEKWDLTVLGSPAEAQECGAFEQTDYQMDARDGWKQVELPASWTSYGFDYSIYTNSKMPFQESVGFPQAPENQNPVGLYRKTFQVKDSMLQENGKVSLTFAGVESAYYVYVNGQEVGYSEDSYNPHSFDITDLLNPKGQENVLAVKVLKFCDGTWMEDQDMIYDGGIFRDVYLTSTTNVHISDYNLVTELADDFQSASVALDVSVKNDSTTDMSGLGAEVTLYDESGSVFAEKDFSLSNVASGDTGKNELIIPVSNPELWDADHPSLYTIVISLYDKHGKCHYESISQNIGFRKLTFTSTQVADRKTYIHTTTQYDTVKINGKRLLLKGVNRHDTDPETGKYVSHEVYEADVKLMKQNNINAVRTSHYANDDYMYYLCDKYGLYMMCETNNESHAIQNNEKQLVQLEQAIMDRQVTAYQRLKNVTSNIIWSIGNESSGNQASGDFADGMFSRMIYYFKDNDSTRMVHYEGTCQGTDSAGGVDMISHMYYAPKDVAKGAEIESKMPYLLCEYDHAMGNAVGNLKEYCDVFRSGDNMLGGFIWDWVDQSRKIALKDGDWDYYARKDAHASGLNQLSGYYLGYGGDWGDEKNDKNFCQNGLVSADRDPQPELKEVKYQYQDFWFISDESSLQGNVITARNESISKKLSEYDVIWELQEDSKVIDSGKLLEELLPGEKKEITVPYTLPAVRKAGADYYLNLSVQLKEDTSYGRAGDEIAYEQFPVSAAVPQVDKKISGTGVTVVLQDGNYLVQGQDFSFELNGTTGAMQNYKYQEQLIMKEGPVPNFDRAELDNDYVSFADIGKTASLNGVPVVEQDADGRYVVTVNLKLDYKGEGKVTVKYIINSNGAVTVNFQYDLTGVSQREYTKVGTVMTLPQGSENITWYGNGDSESYSDRCSYTRVKEYTSTVNDMYYPFVRPQDCGNLTGVKWISVTNPDTGYGVLIAGEKEVNASALHFTAGALNEAKHTTELQPDQETYVTVDAAVSGTGNNSCGFRTLNEYKVTEKNYNFTYTILPVNRETDRIEEAKKYRSYDVVQVEQPDNNTKQPENPAPGNGTDGVKKTVSAKKVTGLTVKSGKKKTLTIRWKKQEGMKYKVAYSTSKSKLSKQKNGKIKPVKSVKVLTAKKNSVTIKKLKSGKKYYVKVCAYCIENKKTQVGKWSGVKTKKVK